MLQTKKQARRRRRLRAAGVLTLLTAVVGGGAYLAISQLNSSEVLVRERCSAVVGTDTYELAPEQAANASTIAGVAVTRGLPPRAVSIALATAVQESGLRNLDYGDQAGPDSRGLFQQRPSQGWGTEEQVQDPIYAAGAFYDELVTVPGYQSLPITEAAQLVQRSAYPDAYADHEPEARAFASALTGQSPASLNCVLRKPVASGSAAAVTERFAAVFPALPTAATEEGLVTSASGSEGWAAAQFAVANAKELGITSVSHAGLQWNRADGGWTTAETETGQVLITLAEVAA
ncbi:hypothetical protein P4U43_04525 [Arthrobacter sp. EH-1B-1]|uniref:Heavy metal transporter n=1 Tax=Arthrobacter vasquezii TaxID=2977629 RepID=A0ABT6CT20_9MICC|nr:MULTISPECIES: hypothetical protein [Arthrobacter]KRF08526.1 hypothetical protein ASH00_02085 [Arthrobacter sp. Soil782]MDF9277055.1 hypothetical protein [Arthrobacter vasquezii]